jgi:endonuclease/exonuclease/phosphatase family metal-dependent hydrolase
MKIVTWNLGYWQFRKHHADAWAYLRDELKPDIALLQEVCPPTLEDGESLLFEEVYNGWGTALYGKGVSFDRITLEEYPSRVAAARVQTSGGQSLCVASIHAPIIENRVFPHLDHIVDEIESVFSQGTFIVGGDLNSARLAEEVWPGYGHGPFFERIDAGRFFDCHRKFHSEEIRTYFRSGQVHPFQDDHLFVSADLADRVVACEVIHNETTRRVSDHIPLVAEIDLVP